MRSGFEFFGKTLLMPRLAHPPAISSLISRPDF